jgi:hypothetical protein
MSHLHFCNFGLGHFYECDGVAVRLFDTEPTPCVCADCDHPIDDGDHTRCSVEHLPCSEHRREHLIECGYDPDNLLDPGSPLSILALFSDEEGYPIFGWCRWCLDSFKSARSFREHQDDLLDNCSALAELRNNPMIMEFLDAMDE